MVKIFEMSRSIVRDRGIRSVRKRPLAEKKIESPEATVSARHCHRESKYVLSLNFRRQTRVFRRVFVLRKISILPTRRTRRRASIEKS